jgi:hypothetical protein
MTGTPINRFDINEPPKLSVSPSQNAIALLLLPAFYGIRCIAYEALVKILSAALTLASVYTYVNQRSTDL